MNKQASVQQMIGYPPKLLKVDGSTYKVGFNDQDAKGRLEEIIGAKIWDRVYAESEHMKPVTRAKHIERYESRFAGGYYSTGGEGWQKEILCPEGVFLFLLSLLQEHHPELTIQDAARLFNQEPTRCKHAIAAVAPDFFTAILRQMGATEEQVQKALPELVAGIGALMEDDEPVVRQASEPDTSESSKPSMKS